MLSSSTSISSLKGRIIGREIIFYEETISTNDDVLRLSKDDRYAEGLVVVADSQKAGKGRHGRRWFSPPGVNLYFTILLRPSILPQKATLLSLMAAVATANAIKRDTGIHASIKWPNDIMIGDKKVGGILLEMRSKKGGIDAIAVGIGLNVNIPPDMFPEEIKEKTTSLKEFTGAEINRYELLGRILNEMDHLYDEFLKGDSKRMIDEWLILNSTTGHVVVVQLMGGRQIEGVAETIDEDGDLIIRLASGDLEKISAGDVTLLR